jgi:predicted RNA-binding Zn ribbon-like protein
MSVSGPDGRDPAGDLDLILDFLNTVDLATGADILDDPEAWQSWIDWRGLASAAVEELRPARDALRASIDIERPGREAAGIGTHPGAPAGLLVRGVRVRFGPGTAAPALVGDDVLGAVAAAAARLAIRGEWPRIKLCPAEDCREAFYDRSRNKSRTWCDMASCGNREKSRQFRRRARAPEPAALDE